MRLTVMDTKVSNEQRFEALAHKLGWVSATLHNVSLALHEHSNLPTDPSGLRGYVGMPGPRGRRGPDGPNVDGTSNLVECIDPVEELMQILEYEADRLLQQVKTLNDLNIVKEQYNIKK